MCGILGYYAFGSHLPDKDAITQMFVETQTRGSDASGFAYINKRSLVVHKQPIPAEELVFTKEWVNLSLPKILIMHCRQTTQGNASNNENNHPVFTKSGWAVIHNGFIRNDDSLFKKLSLPRDGRVDTEIVVRLLELGKDWDTGINHINTINGSMACAAIYKNKPDDLLLFRNSNPITLGYDKEKDILYFASTEDILSSGLSENTNLRGFIFNSISKNIEIWDMPRDVAYLISKDGMTKEWNISDDAFNSSNSFNFSGRVYNPPKVLCGKCGNKMSGKYRWVRGILTCSVCYIRS